MSFWTSLRGGKTRHDDLSGYGDESGSENASDSIRGNDDKEGESDINLSAPPRKNVFQHASRMASPFGGDWQNLGDSFTGISPMLGIDGNGIVSIGTPTSPERALADLTRRRPLDPVLRAGASEEMLPKITGNPRLNQPPTVQVFDPSHKSVTSHSVEANIPELAAQVIPTQVVAAHEDPNNRVIEDDENLYCDEYKQELPLDDEDSSENQEGDASTDGSSESPRREMGLDDTVYVWGGSDNGTETTEELGEDVATENGSDGSESRNNDGWEEPVLSPSGSEAWDDIKAIQVHMGKNGEESLLVEAEDSDHSQDSVNTCGENQDESAEPGLTLTPPTGNLAIEPDPACNGDLDIAVHPKLSKFVFLSDQNDVPFGLKMLQERTVRRRRDMLARMHELDCNLAKIYSDFAEEKMDLDLAVRDTLDRSVSQPLEATTERLIIEREASSTRGRCIGALEQRLMKLDLQMTRQIYVVLGDRKRDELDSLHSDLFHDLVPRINIENSKSNKIESGVIRRFEDVSGSATKSFHEECGARRSSVHQAQQKVRVVIKSEDQRLDHILVAISELRAKTRKERAERREMDARILERIVSATVIMKRALLEAVGDSN